ncbi:MAG: dienelactone hydrolase family protein [Proteobacteria bacterium]|nr:dienelactone hydrolase family protein [Pseudomonadota bacterium]
MTFGLTGIRRLFAACLLLSSPVSGSAAQEAVAPILPPGFTSLDLVVGGRNPATIKAYLLRPAVQGAVPAVVALHGCGGLFSRKGSLTQREADWAARLSAEGYAVLFPDSFNPRGYRQVCTLKGGERPIHPRARADDVRAAIAWLSQQPGIDKTRIAIMGWSNGGSTVLETVDRKLWAAGSLLPKAAIAFYPGCRPASERPDYAPAIPLTILIGDSDNWTPPAPCRVLAQRNLARLIEYPGAVHDFDHPNAPRRTRTGVGLSADGTGRVEVGTDPAARAAAIEAVRATLAGAFRR